MFLYQILEMTPTMNKFFYLSLALIAMSGIYTSCQRIGPAYKNPQIRLPDHWEIGQDQILLKQVPSVVQEEDELPNWWAAFHDAVLERLINRALENNPEVHIAYQRLQEYQALLLESRADYFPMVHMGMGHTNAVSPEDGILFQQPSLINYLKTQNVKNQRRYDFFHLGPMVSWEIDLFGRLRSENLARKAELGASHENLMAIQLSITAEISKAYLRLRSIQHQLLAEETYQQILQARANLLKERLVLNHSSLDSIAQVKIKICESKNAISQFKKYFEQYKHRLLTLMGETLWPFEENLLCYAPMPRPKVQVALGVPSDLLHQRPDIRQADRELAAATYRIGRVMAEALPHFALIGSIGGMSKQLADILSFKNLYWLYEPLTSFPLFDAGKNKATVNVYKARAKVAFSHYHQKLLNAVEEVQLALHSLQSEEKRLAENKNIYSYAASSLKRAHLLYQQGIGDFVAFNLAEDEAHRRKMQWLVAEEEYALSYVTLCKALGGKAN
ncbi:Efflux pump, RND family, outer membrane lipoprotein [Neochlamydia sp. EPS4]|nr:Efflux pump, RND family, outer membrane lipoprotein [Neochlamydia sp. EPS4]